MVSNNDCGVRDFDLERFVLCKHFIYPWPVNVSTVLKFISLFIDIHVLVTDYQKDIIRAVNAYCCLGFFSLIFLLGC